MFLATGTYTLLQQQKHDADTEERIDLHVKKQGRTNAHVINKKTNSTYNK